MRILLLKKNMQNEISLVWSNLQENSWLKMNFLVEVDFCLLLVYSITLVFLYSSKSLSSLRFTKLHICFARDLYKAKFLEMSGDPARRLIFWNSKRVSGRKEEQFSIRVEAMEPGKETRPLSGSKSVKMQGQSKRTE
jgi:hypothetical protein